MMSAVTTTPPRVGVLGGTGKQGRGLALRLAMSGLDVVIGSRRPGDARRVATEIGHGVTGLGNAECASRSDIVIVAVPYESHRDLLVELRECLAGKIVVDCVNPLGFDAHGPYAIHVDEGSAAEQAAEVLPESSVVGAFHGVSAARLLDVDQERLELDILVMGDDRHAVARVCQVVEYIPGMRAIHGGRLRNCGAVEAFTANLICISRRHRTQVGLRITELPASSTSRVQAW